MFLMRILFLSLLILTPGFVFAVNGFRNSDVRLDKFGLTELIVGKTLELGPARLFGLT